MNEILIRLMIFFNGIVIGFFIGYLLGRYRIKIRRVEEPEEKEEKPLFLRKIMD